MNGSLGYTLPSASGPIPAVVFWAKSGKYWSGKEGGYTPTHDDERFSIWTDIASYLVMFLILSFALLT